MHIYITSIPTQNIYSDTPDVLDIFFVKIHTKDSPTYGQIVSIVQSLHDRDIQYPEYDGEWARALNTLHALDWKDFPIVKGSVIHSNTFVKVSDRYEMMPLTVSRVEVF